MWAKTDMCSTLAVPGKLRIGLGEESIVSALAHARLLHSDGGQDKDGALANLSDAVLQTTLWRPSALDVMCRASCALG